LFFFCLGFFQLAYFESELFQGLLKETLKLNGNVDPTGIFLTPNSPMISFELFSRIWGHLNQHFEDLNDFEQLHIIPLECQSGMKLLRLKGLYVLKTVPGMKTLSCGVQEALSTLSIIVIDDIPSTIIHSKLRGMYCKFPTVGNILQLLRQVHAQHNFSEHSKEMHDFTNHFNEVC